MSHGRHRKGPNDTPDGRHAKRPASGSSEADRPRGQDEPAVLPAQTSDDTDAGWGEEPDTNDERLLAERPPHWE